MSYLGPDAPGEQDPPILESIQSAFGFVPNTYRDQKIRPDLIEAQINLVGALLVKEGALTRQQKEYIFLVCAAANLSTYCVTLHCEIVRMLGLAGLTRIRSPSTTRRRTCRCGTRRCSTSRSS